MKIAGYQVMTLAVPEDDPLANMPEEAGRTRPTVILRLRTDSGIEGIGVTLYGGRATRSLHAMMEDLCAGIVGFGCTTCIGNSGDLVRAASLQHPTYN